MGFKTSANRKAFFAKKYRVIIGGKMTRYGSSPMSTGGVNIVRARNRSQAAKKAMVWYERIVRKDRRVGTIRFGHRIEKIEPYKTNVRTI